MIVIHGAHKYCRVCREFQPASGFHRDRTQPDGRCPYCKECKRAKVQAWRAAHPEERREQDRRANQRYRAKPEKAAARRAYNRQWHSERYHMDPRYRERARERYRRRYRSDPEFAERKRQDARIYKRLQAEREGRPLKPTGGRGRGGYVMLDPTPVIAFVEAADSAEAAALGDPILARALRRVMSGASRRVELGVVDRLLIAHDLLLHDLYDPDLYPELYE